MLNLPAPIFVADDSALCLVLYAVTFGHSVLSGQSGPKSTFYELSMRLRRYRFSMCLTMLNKEIFPALKSQRHNCPFRAVAAMTTHPSDVTSYLEINDEELKMGISIMSYRYILTTLYR